MQVDHTSKLSNFFMSFYSLSYHNPITMEIESTLSDSDLGLVDSYHNPTTMEIESTLSDSDLVLLDIEPDIKRFFAFHTKLFEEVNRKRLFEEVNRKSLSKKTIVHLQNLMEEKKFYTPTFISEIESTYRIVLPLFLLQP